MFPGCFKMNGHTFQNLRKPFEDAKDHSKTLQKTKIMVF